jgi:hypothetical protein
MKAALIASKLACKYLYTNGMIVFTVNEDSYLDENKLNTLSPQRLMRDC